MPSRKQLDLIIQLLVNKGKIQEVSVKILTDAAKQILVRQNNVVKVTTPVSICGDIHGQFDDLLELFRVGGLPPYTNYIFLGDYVDRGRDSLRTFLLLLALKIKYKNRVTLLRGNHQSRLTTQIYGFYDECITKYNSLKIWKICTQTFDYLPLAAIIDDHIFCVHGGISQSIKTINQIQILQRIQQIPQQGGMCDLLWSDPNQKQGWTKSNRGVSYLYGRDTVQTFCHLNSLSLIARAHQLVMQGYLYHFNEKVVTVWSAPNYCYRCSNVASIMQLDDNKQKFFKIFDAAPIQTKQDSDQVIPHYFL